MTVLLAYCMQFFPNIRFFDSCNSYWYFWEIWPIIPKLLSKSVRKPQSGTKPQYTEMPKKTPYNSLRLKMTLTNDPVSLAPLALKALHPLMKHKMDSVICQLFLNYSYFKIGLLFPKLFRSNQHMPNPKYSGRFTIGKICVPFWSTVHVVGSFLFCVYVCDGGEGSTGFQSNRLLLCQCTMHDLIN